METRDFQEFVSNTNLIEMKSVGRQYTWSNNQVLSKIDWIFVNAQWIQQWPHMEGVIMDPLFSNHSPLRIQLEVPKERKSGSFKFYNYLADHPRFLQVVETYWRKPCYGTHMLAVWNKLQTIKKGMQQLPHKEFKGIGDKVSDSRAVLIGIKQQMRDHSRQAELVQAAAEAKKQLEKWVLVEESIARQKSKVTWLKLGDANIAYFHACLKNRQVQDQIIRLVNKQGGLLITEQEIEHEVSEFYKELLGSSTTQLPVVLPDIMSSGPILNWEQQRNLVSPVSREEVYDALQDINDSKAPDNDWFNALFFKKAWPVIGQDVTDAILDCFKSGQMYSAINCAPSP
ncbi:uncharacterized protein LOC132612018 [Lycium barbarum]|uniref:uncharacterized protein LOC132612018 n=1 Tax=Lycium barbarum TaxID=112863 RepID=UPI00293F49E5|nr:uncharacterized protein LOC132612018 [Lycium barbarum]